MPLTIHPKSGMPLTLEYRLFFKNHQLIACLPYWDEGKYEIQLPDLTLFKQVALNIKSQFFTMDIAQTQKGNWIIVELGDGQVAGLPNTMNKDLFYKNILNTQVI